MIGDCICHLVSSQYGGKCHIASGQGLADAYDVWLYSGMFPGEKFPVRPKPVAISSKISNR